MGRKRSLVFGVGLNDGEYTSYTLVSGKRFRCPFYSRWNSMLKRCYSKKYHCDRSTYIDCSVCDEWLTFSNFKKWMGLHDWKGKHLDKDILVKGNKVYSPEFCLFVDHAVNNFTTDHGSARGDCMIGVHIHKQSGKFVAQCCNPFNKKGECLGYFDAELDAHLAWKNRKHELSCQLANLQTDERLANALRYRYA